MRGLAPRVAVAVALAAAGPRPAARIASAEEPPKVSVPAAVRAAVDEYLKASGKDEAPALQAALAALKDDVAVAAEALRTHAPLTKAKPGVEHGLTFPSGGKTWEYSILLPKGYDGKKAFPVLVLPDHGLVSPEDGIGFWAGKSDSDEYVVFRPVITKFQEDESRIPKAPFLARDAALARVMGDALVHLRLHYAVDCDRFAMTGLSQAGFYTWYYAASFPDSFAAIVPESSGGTVIPLLVLPVARNLAHLHVRILHAKSDRKCPFEDAVKMKDAIAAAGGAPELIAYEDSDFLQPNPLFHPGPHPLRLRHVLPWAKEQRRTVPTSFTRVLRWPQQGLEGRFRIDPPKDPKHPVVATCSETDGVLTCDVPGADYLVSPEDVVAKRTFEVGGRTVVPKPDLKKMLTSFKASGDPGRLVAAEISLRR